jgi:ATP-binding cassette subfamily B protein/subfamily B ATP-binding cassette protein MsbA
MAGNAQPVDTRMLAIARWAMPYAFHRWPGLLAVLMTMLLKIGLDVLKPWPMKILVDHSLDQKAMPPALAAAVAAVLGEPEPRLLLIACVMATILLFFISWLLTLLAALSNISFGQRMVYDLAADLFGHLQRLSLQFHSRGSVGDMARRITADCGCVSAILKDALLPAVSSGISLIVMFIIMWRMNPVLTVCSLGVLPVMILALRLYMQPMQDRAYAQQETEARIYTHIEETLAAIPVVQAYSREPLEVQRFRGTTRDVLAAILSTTRVQLQFKILTGLAIAAGTAGILWLGTREALAGRLTTGDLLVFLAYLGSLYTPLSTLMYTPTTIQGAGGSARRVLELLAKEQTVRDRPHAKALARARGEVTLENVTFGYEPGRPVLHNLSLAARPGQTIAVVGPSGAGKSTLASLLPRLFDPWEGTIRLDGHDLRDIKLFDLRRQVALVLQEPFLFPRTVAENLAYGRPDATEAQIEAAAEAANAHEFIRKLPKGYQTVLGPRGATLSGGQRQRLSIARALLTDAPVLVLDEPTSALDTGTEASLMTALQRLMEARTTFIIAHRLSTIRNADLIVVLNRGRIVQTGRHADLIHKAGLYLDLYGAQFAGEKMQQVAS